MAFNSTFDKLSAAGEKLLNRAGFENLPLADRLRLAARELKQEGDFGYTAEMITDRSEAEATASKCDMGVQADIRFDGTVYENAFDTAVDALRAYARMGTENAGYRSSTEEAEGPVNLYGQLNRIAVNGREYDVIEDTRSDHQEPHVSIRGVTEKSDSGGKWVKQSEEAGSYYIEGVASRKDGSQSGTRKIELCGAHMSIEDTMGDIMHIIKAAETARALQEQSK